MNDESLNNRNYNIDNNSEEEENEENIFSEYDNSNYIKQNILFCPNKYCNMIPEIYFDEITSSVYLFCNKNKKKEKHKYYISLKKYLNDNALMSSSKLKDEEEKELQEINSRLSDELNQEIEDMKNKIKLQKKYLENLTDNFNSLIQKIVNDFTHLLENKLSILLFEKKIIYTFLKYNTDQNAIKNFQNLSNFMQNIVNNDENNAYNKNIINENNEHANDNENTNNNNYIKKILDRIKTLSKIFSYFESTSHNIMSVNKRKTVFEMSGVNNMCILKNGNLCFSSDFGVVNIYKYNKKKNNFEIINKLKPAKNNIINYITQLSNDLLICCSKKLIIGKLTNNDKEYEIYQKIDEFDNFNIVKVIELTNNHLATYDRSFQISIFKPLLTQNNIQYQLIYNKINKGEQIYSLLALPNNNNINISQYISTSNCYSSNGNSCLRFYSSLINYSNYDTIYDINCSRFVDSVLMINNELLCVGVQDSSSLNGIALVHINTRQIVTFIEEQSPTAIYKLKNDLIAVGMYKSSYDDGELIPEKKINFYFLNDNNELIFINTINSCIKNNICSFGELNNIDELIIVGNQFTKVFQ